MPGGQINEDLCNGDNPFEYIITRSSRFRLAYSCAQTRHGSSMTKIEMKDLEQCNEQGALYMANQAIQANYREGREFICVEGK